MIEPSTSPRWSSSTKLVVAFTMIAVIAALVVKFQSILPPLIISFILVYLFYPAATFFHTRLRFTWGISVGILYLVLVIVLLGLATLTGLEVVNQMESVVALVEGSLEEVQSLSNQLSTLSWHFGPFNLDMARLDLNAVSNQIIETVRPMLGQTGELLGALASGAMNTLGWLVFVLLVSYFILAESDGLKDGIFQVNLPGFKEDFERLGQELGRIWNAFLRGQLILVGVASLIYAVLLTVLGVPYAIGLALMAGLARFLPYIGPFISWTVLALVAFFQTEQPWNISPLLFAAIVVGWALVIDGIMDNYVAPRIMAETLKVHPAAVLVAAIVALDLLGVLGVVIAAPILATAQLVGRYLVRKMFDMNPWEGLEESPIPPPLREQIAAWFEKLRARLTPGKIR